MIKINKIQTLDDHKIYFIFSDNTEKVIDFKQFIKSDKFTRQLSDPEYFKLVKIYENGRGIYWPNEYDFCPDFLRKFADK
ncbi:MAG: DUF2442 domain-containing protein [Bacteroidota bacterium]